MPTINVSDDAFIALQRLATARDIITAELIDRLINNLTRRTDEVPIHGLIAGRRIEAIFYPATGGVRITAGAFTGHHYTHPGRARDAVNSTAFAEERHRGDGWDFWTITDTGLPLSILRRISIPHATPGADDVH